MNSRGNVFIIIIGILGIIFTMATFFMQTTVEEKGQTERSARNIQAQCLAEAGLEMAIGYLAKDLNNPMQWNVKESLGHRLRLPLQKQDGRKLSGMKDNLGSDILLDITGITEPIKLTRDDLEMDGGPQLDELFKYMVGDAPGAKYNLEITIKPDKALTNVPGSSVDGNNYKVPGVDIEWECHSRVKDFLNGKGYPAIKLSLPEGLTWLKFEIPVVVMGVPVYSFDLLGVMKGMFSSGAIGDLLDKTDLHKLLLWAFRDTGYYPYEILLAKDLFPALTDKFKDAALPSGIDDSLTVEKSGFLSVESRATITYADQKAVSKAVIATKEFKCADVEPVAPLYSFFVSNLSNSKIGFNNLGGNLFVNNFSGFSAITKTPSEPEKKELPGLIRVNGTQRMDVNLSLMGNPAGPGIKEGDSFVMKIARGCEWLLMADLGGIHMPAYNANQGFTVSVKENLVTNLKNLLPSKLKGLAETGMEKLRESAENPPDKPAESKKVLDQIVGFLDLNIFPPTKFGVKIWEAPLHFIFKGDRSFGKWELPYCGNSWNQFTLPLPFFSTSVTHFFGTFGVFPTLTREVEGNVTKRYRQWNLGVISYPLGPMPLGNQIPTPWGIMLLPVPLPMWHTHTEANKYEYNFWTFKNEDAKVQPGVVRVYDPGYQENSPPNLYSIEQYAKKATFYYPTAKDFEDDIPNRLVKVGDKDCFKLDGITFVRESITLPPKGQATFYVTGRGGIVCGGNVSLKGNIEDPFSEADERKKETPRTVFSLIIRSGGLIISTDSPQYLRFEGSLYTDKCIGISPGRSLTIAGNWVTNVFSKALTRGEISVEYNSFKVRSSLNSIHPSMGKYDPERYFVSFAPAWETWMVQ